MSHLKTLVAGAALALMATVSFAQAATPRVDQRESNQDTRIQNGVASGQLNAREALRLEKEQAAINRAEHHAKADGKVSRAERLRLHRLQNRASHDIHAQKHDPQTARP